jgi:solute carrier family 8 (sodium/calcium exchanger)
MVFGAPDCTPEEGIPTPACCPGEFGTILPPFYTDESTLPTAGAAVYLTVLLWTFQGVNIVSDYFMSAIEVITSDTREHFQKDPVTGEQRKFRIKVWNDCVANLTLMALGSSAPEILLSVIELLGNGMFTGELGASTIVGSAAFNLFVISGICIVSIPWDPENWDKSVRYIEGTKVYAVTASFSVFAYLWLYIVLEQWTPNEVTIVEAVLTFLMFPLLVGLAYAMDKEWLFTRKHESKDKLMGVTAGADGGLDQTQVQAVRQRLRTVYGGQLSEDKLTQLVIAEIDKGQKKSRAAYRINAQREMAGGKKIDKPLDNRIGTVVPMTSSEDEGELAGPTVGWSSTKHSVLEKGELDDSGNATGYVTLTMVRTETGFPAEVYYKTHDGDGEFDERLGKTRGIATAPNDYKHKEGWVVFGEETTEVQIQIEIIDDKGQEPDEDFYVTLDEVKVSKEHEAKHFRVNKEAKRTTVTIIDDDDPGNLQFATDDYHVQESCGSVKVEVERVNGSNGVITCEYKTADVTATAGKDYTHVEGVLEFLDSETKKIIEIPVHDDAAIEKDEKFTIHIYNATGGAKFTSSTDGGADEGLADVHIHDNPATTEKVNKIMAFYARQAEANKIGTANWGQQFTEAIYCNGSAEESAAASCADKIFHYITVLWKVLFAIIPPTDFLTGKLCFVCSLSMIGFVTAIIGDLATFLGCAAGLQDDVTAITLVALGTSLPDTFASKAAAIQDEYADASIGNVTGSNSVNVFLGLGMPWVIGAFYWSANYEDRKDDWMTKTYRGATYGAVEGSNLPTMGFDVTCPNGCFIVPAGTLAYSVAWFSALAVTCILFLFVRRKTVGAELGGPPSSKIPSALFCISLWIIYLVASILKSMS